MCPGSGATSGGWIPLYTWLPAVVVGATLVTMATGAERLAQCQAHCDGGDADALRAFCDRLPASSARLRQIQQFCYQAADKLRAGSEQEIQECRNMCARAFNWGRP